jgi:hypothetical protein
MHLQRKHLLSLYKKLTPHYGHGPRPGPINQSDRDNLKYVTHVLEHLLRTTFRNRLADSYSITSMVDPSRDKSFSPRGSFETEPPYEVEQSASQPRFDVFTEEEFEDVLRKQGFLDPIDK